MRLHFAVGLCLFLAVPAPAAEPSPLAGVPASCPVVIHLRGVERTRDRVLATVESAMPRGRDADKFLREFKEGINGVLTGKAVPGRSLRGVPKDGSVFLALAELPDDPQELPTALVAIVRVTDYADFRDGLLTRDEREELKKKDGYETAEAMGQQLFFIKRTDYAVVALRREIAEKFVKTSPGLDGKLDKDIAAQLLKADLAVYIDPVAIGKKYGEQLLAFRQSIEQQAGAEGSPIAGSPEMVAVVKVLFKGVTQFLRDSRAVLFTFNAEPEGLKLHAQVLVERDTKTARLLKDEVPEELSEIGDLPAREAVFDAVKPAKGEEWQKLVQALTRAMAGRKEFEESSKLEDEAGVKLTLSAHRDRLGTEGIEVTVCDKPAKLVESHRKMYAGLKAGEPADGNLLLAEKPEFTADAESHRDFKFHRVRLIFDLEKSAKASFVTPEFLRRQVGGDEGQVWFGTDGKIFVELRAHSWGDAKKHLDTYLDRGDDRLGKRDGFLKARKQLPQRVSFLFIEDTSVYTQLMLDWEATTSRRLVRKEAPKPRPGDEAYWGTTFTLQKDGVTVDGWVPTRVFKDYFIGLGLGER